MGIIFRELVDAHLEAKDAKDALRQLGAMFLRQGFVKDSYIDAVVEREKLYPTGLNLKDISIAMPHTDKSHVYRPGIAIGLLKEPVKFMHMGSTGDEVNAKLIFMMSIDDPEEQIDSIKKVMRLFMNEAVIAAFNNVQTSEELYKIAKKHLE